MELLPSCDPRLSDAVPSTSIYFGVNESIKTAIENAARLASENSLCQLREDSQKAVGSVKDSNMVRDDGALRRQEATTEKSRIKLSSQKTPSTQSDVSSLKQTNSVSRKQVKIVQDEKSANANLIVSVAPSREHPRSGTENIERGSKRSVTKVHTPRKRKRKDFEELPEHKDRFPSMAYLWDDEITFLQHLSQLSYFAELEKNPDDPMLLMSLCEFDDIAAYQRQDFISDLNSAYIGRKPRFTSVRFPYSDRTFNRLGQLSLQTYCDGHFIECAPVSRVHMASLHQWASREALEKVVCNMWSDNQRVAVRLPYPSVRSVSDVVCFWLSCQLCYSMSDVGIDCLDPPDIFVGSSVQSELTTNCLYQMFCRYVDFLSEKSERYFRDMDNHKAADHAGRGVEVETCARGSKRTKLLKQTSSPLRKKALRQTGKQSFSRRMNVEYDYEDAMVELDNYGSFEDADVEQVTPYHEMVGFGDDFAEKAAGYGHREDDVSAIRRKRKLSKDYYDDREHHTGRDMQPKARRLHQDRTRLSAREKEYGGDVYRRKRDRQRVRQRDADGARLARRDVPPSSTYEDSSDFMLYDEEGNIVVQCSDTGRMVVVEEAKAEGALKEDEAADVVPNSVSVLDELYQSNSPLYSVVHDHCYTSVSQSSVESVTPAVPDMGKEEHVTNAEAEKDAVDARSAKDSENNNPVLTVTPLELSNAGDAKGPLKDHELAVSRKTYMELDSVIDDKNTKNNENKNPVLSVTRLELTDAGRNSVAKVPPKDRKQASGGKTQLSSDSAIERTAKRIHPLSSLAVVNTAPRPQLNAKSLVKSRKPPVATEPVRNRKPVRPQQKVGKECLMDAEPVRQQRRAEKERRIDEEPVIRQRKMEKERRMDAEPVRHQRKAGKEHRMDAEPVRRQRKTEKERRMDVQKRSDVHKNEYSKLNKSKTPDTSEVVHKEDSSPVSVSKDTRDKAEVSHKSDSAVVSVSVDGGSPKQKQRFSAPSETSEISIDVSKISTKKQENTEKVSGAVDKVPANIDQQGNASDDVKISESHSVSVDNDTKVADAEVSVKGDDKDAAEEVPCAAELAAAARAASHYEDAYLSEITDAYGVLPLSNFDEAFDPTNVPDGHLYNPFRRTWPILQHVVDGKSDLLLKVCSFPDVSSFSIRRVMRENGFLWAVCLSLFEPVTSKPDSTDSSLYYGLDLNAANKGKGAKSSNPLMQAFRQAVEAKKKVAAKSKLPVGRQNSDDGSGTQAWSAKRPAGKMSIVFGSGVKSGGSLSSVVRADQLAKKESPANFSNLLTSAISKMNSDISDMITRKCGEQCLDKGASTAEYKSSLAMMSKHFDVLSDMAVDMYDVAEYKLEKMFAAKDAEKSERDKESVVVSETSAAAVTTAATATSSPASEDISSSSALPVLPVVTASKTSTAETTPLPADERLASVAAQVSQSSASQPVAAESVTTAASSNVSMVTSGTLPVSAATPVTAKVVASTVADMPPPPLPPLSLSCIGVGFGVSTTSSASEVSTSRPSSLHSSVSATQVSTNVHTAAYKPGGFAYAPPVSTVPSSGPAAFASPSLPLGQLIHMPPPTIQPNLYPMPPPVGIPLNVPPPGFLDTSLPPPRVASYPPAPWYPPSTSAAGGYPAAGGNRAAAVPGSGFKDMSDIPSTAASSAGAPGSLQGGKPVATTAAVEMLKSTGVGVTNSFTVCGVPAVTSTASQQQHASSVTYPSPLPHTAGVLTNQRPPTTDSSASAASLVPGSQPRPAFSPGLRPGLPRASVASLPIQGNRPLGPLKTVTPVTQSVPRLPGPVMGQGMSVPVRPVITTQPDHVSTSSPLVGQGPRSVHPAIQSALPTAPGIQPRGVVRPTSEQPGNTNNQPRATGPLVGQSPRGAVPPPPVPPIIGQSSQPRAAVPGGQPQGTIRPTSTQPTNPTGLPRPTGPLVGQSPRGAVRPVPPVSNSNQPRGVLPVSTQPNSTNGQPSAAGPIQGQSLRGAVRPGPPMMNQPTPPQGAGQPRGPVRPVLARRGHPATSGVQTSPSLQLSVTSGTPGTPSHPAQPAGVIQHPPRPLTPAGAASTGQGRLLTPSSRVYVMNSDSLPVCKDVEVSR